jgi:hypothetical protein
MVMADDPTQGDDSLDELLGVIDTYAATGKPLDLLGLASSATAIVRHPGRDVDPLKALLHEQVLEAMVDRYAEIGSASSVAFAATLAGIAADPVLRGRLRSGLDGTEAELPGWLAALDDARLEQPTLVRDLLDADEWLLAGVRLADDGRFTFRIEVDHDADGLVADGVLMGMTVEAILDRLRATAPEDEVLITELTPSELAGRYAEAIAVTDAAPDPPRSDTWPGCRPLVEWALTLPLAPS